MTQPNTIILRDRQHGAHVLAEKLMRYRNSDAIVTGVGPGGTLLGFYLAKELNLLFEMILCRRIKHPGDRKRTIGSVSDGEVLIHDESHDIPRDLIMHQITKLKHEIKSDYEFLFEDRQKPSFKNITVILVCDLLDTSDKLIAALRSIKSQKPLQIVVAAPFVASQAVSSIVAEADELVFLQLETGYPEGRACYEDFPKVDLPDVKRLLNESTRNLESCTV